MIPLLKFSKSNGKLSNRLIFSLPAGYSCPHAGVCRTTADRTTGEVTDHPPGCSEARGYRCFAAMAEARFPAVRNPGGIIMISSEQPGISMQINIQVIQLNII